MIFDKNIVQKLRGGLGGRQKMEKFRFSWRGLPFHRAILLSRMLVISWASILPFLIFLIARFRTSSVK